MRIYRAASRVLGSVYFTAKEDQFDKYLVHFPYRESFVNSDSYDKMEAEDNIWKQKQWENEEVKDQKPAHKEKQGGEMRKMKENMDMVQEDMVVIEMEDVDRKQASVWYYHKNDGKGWHCRNIVVGPKTFCDYHLAKSRSYYTRTSETVVAASSKSGRRKASIIGKSALPKSSSKPTPTGTPTSLRAASASAQNNSKAAASSMSVPTSSQPCNKKAGKGLGDNDYYFYDLSIPIRTKDCGGIINHRVTTVGVEEKEFLPQDNTVVIEEKDDKKEYNDIDNLLDNSSIASDDDESDEDYIIGGTSKPHAKKGKRKLLVH